MIRLICPVCNRRVTAMGQSGTSQVKIQPHMVKKRGQTSCSMSRKLTLREAVEVVPFRLGTTHSPVYKYGGLGERS